MPITHHDLPTRGQVLFPEGGNAKAGSLGPAQMLGRPVAVQMIGTNLEVVGVTVSSGLSLTQAW